MICHAQSLRTAFTPAHVQLCCDGVYLALPVTRTTVGVWSLQDITCKVAVVFRLTNTCYRAISGSLNVKPRNEPLCDKTNIITNIMSVRPVKTQISLGICPV